MKMQESAAELVDTEPPSSTLTFNDAERETYSPLSFSNASDESSGKYSSYVVDGIYIYIQLATLVNISIFVIMEGVKRQL